LVKLPTAEIRQLDHSPPNSASHRLIADSGASAHFTPRREFIRNFRPLDPPLAVEGALGEIVYATEQGDGEIPLGDHTLHLENIIFCERVLLESDVDRPIAAAVVEIQHSDEYHPNRSSPASATPTMHTPPPLHHAQEIYLLLLHSCRSHHPTSSDATVALCHPHASCIIRSSILCIQQHHRCRLHLRAVSFIIASIVGACEIHSR
jgi:hypothetical protein